MGESECISLATRITLVGHSARELPFQDIALPEGEGEDHFLEHGDVPATERCMCPDAPM